MIEAIKPVPCTPKEINLINFWAKVNKDGPTMPHMNSQCWVWTATKVSGGYGHFGVARKLFLAHRVSWMIANGPIPTGLLACHHCDNPSCVNPSHLFLGTSLDNARDKEKKGRGNQARGYANGAYTKPERRPRGDAHGARLHPERMARGEKIGNSKLTAAQVMEIRVLRDAGGMTLTQLGARFGVDHTLISLIARRKIWKHLP
jgi:hypothetical protein